MINSEIDFLIKNGITAYEARIQVDGSAIEFDRSNLEKFVEFLTINQIKSVFYDYDRIEKDDLMINVDVLRRINQEKIYDILEEKFEKYNNRIAMMEDSDFERPIGIYIGCVYNGIVTYMYCDDYWFIDMGFQLPDIAAIKVIEENLDSIPELLKQEKMMIENKRSDLKEIIYNDPEFQDCTNQSLRKKYAKVFFDKHPEYRELFYKNGLIRDLYINEFVEDIWREYKKNK